MSSRGGDHGNSGLDLIRWSCRLGGRDSHASSGGIIYDIVVGIAGALLGGFIMGKLGHAGVTGFNWRSFAVAVAGAIILIVILGLFRGRGRLRGRRAPGPQSLLSEIA